MESIREEVHMRQEVRELVQAADTLFANDSSLTEDEREVLATLLDLGREISDVVRASCG